MGKVLHTKGISGGGGTGTGWDGQVEFRADLPITLGTPIVGEIYLVEKKTTLLGFTTYQSGLYIRDLNNGSLSDWRRLNVKVNFTDSEFAVVSAADNSKKAKFDMSLITTSTTRNYTWQDKDLIVAGLDDIAAHGLPEVLAISNVTGLNDISIADGQVVKATNGGGLLDLRRNGNNGSIALLGDAAIYIQGGVFGASTTSYISANTVAMEFAMFNSTYTRTGSMSVKDNQLAATSTSNISNFPTTFATQNATINLGLINSAIGGGLNVKAKTDNTLYSNQIGFNAGALFETILSHTTATADRLQTLQDKDGIIALLSDISGGGGPSLRNITATDTFVTASETLNCTANTFTVNLPTAVGIQGVTYTLVNSGTGIITLDADGTETINGSLTIEIKRQYLSRTVQSDGTNWIVI